MSRLVRRIWPLAAAFTLLAVMVPGPAYGAGFFTDEDPMITLEDVPAGSQVRALISSGDVVDGVMFQGIPDGVGMVPGSEPGTVDVYVAHEQSTVPFRDQADFEDASVAKLTLSTLAAGMRGAVLSHEVAIPASDGYLRFCSASVAGPAEGFDTYTFFTGEESNDIVDIQPGQPFSPDPSIAPQRQAGYAVALDTATGDYTSVPGMGRLNHENTIALPGYRNIVLVTTDDTFSGPSAQLYLYIARDQDGVFDDTGKLYAFQATSTQDGAVNPRDPFNGANDYLDLQPGDDFSGRFIRVPDAVADGTLANLSPQDGLETWSNDKNVFQFIRLEDLAYDKNQPNVVYIADTGRSRVVPDPATGRLVRGPSGTVGLADNGRIFKMVFDPHNPTRVLSLTVLADGDAPNSDVYVPMRAPDNVDTSAYSLMVQEDADDALVWRQDLATGDWTVVASVNDPDGESSGIVDASQWYGSGSWLLTVQGHGANVAEEQIGDTLFKTESGQLLLMRIPGT